MTEASMQCPKCHAEAVDGRRFCKICGTALISPAQTQPVVGAASVERVAVSTNGQSTPTVNCPKCGSTITTGRPFCGRCGAKLGTPQQARSAAPAVTRATRPPARPRKPINWRKVGPPVGVLTLLAGVAIGAWHFWPRVLLPPEKTGTIFDRATSGNSVVFN